MQRTIFKVPRIQKYLKLNSTRYELGETISLSNILRLELDSINLQNKFPFANCENVEKIYVKSCEGIDQTLFDH